MAAEFKIYFENDTLRQQIEPLLSSIPPFFQIKPCEGECDMNYSSHPDWKNFPFPAIENTIYIFDGDGKNLKYGGGFYQGSISIMIRKKDLYWKKIISLRIWHELLHAVGQPADEMKEHVSEWISSDNMRIIFNFCVSCHIADNPIFQEKYYYWLTKRAENAEV